MKVHLAAVGTMIALSFGQILLKMLATYIGSVPGRIIDQTPVMMKILAYLVGIGAIYSAVLVLWLVVLRSVELNRAFLYASLTFVFVPLLSFALLGETIRPATVIGAACIIVGIAVSALL